LRKKGASAEKAAGAATPAEVDTAVRALTRADLHRLRSFAFFRARRLGPAGFGLGPQDLIQQALLKTLEGQRSWNKGSVSFLGHLMGVIRSDVSHHGEQARANPPVRTEADMPRKTEDDSPGPLELLPDRAASPESSEAAKQEIERIRGLFGDDTLVTLLIDGLAEGMKGPEIQEALGVSRAEYEAAMKRLRRGARREQADGVRNG
jgi:DNA-directed RNA polymerase specialized sigma24 family protein